MGYTWRNDGSSYNPGKLDYIIYTDSNISISKHFVLNTLPMPNDLLIEWGLEVDDTYEASDHLPRIVDFSFNDLGVSNDIDTPRSFSLKNPYPNPFNPRVNIPIYLENKSHIKLNIYDIHGKLVVSLADGVFLAGNTVLRWDGTAYANGIYFVHLQGNNELQTQKIILLK